MRAMIQTRVEMNKLSETEAKEIAAKYLDDDQIRNPHQETTQADELYRFWKWNPPGYTKGQPDHWGEWKVFRLIDPEAGDSGIHEMGVDMAGYYVKRSETDRDYWDALRKIVADKLGASNSSIRLEVTDNLYLCRWLVDFVLGHRDPPNKQPGNPARKYHARDGCIYFAMEALCEDGPLSQSAASEWIADRINLSKEAVISIYRKARKP